MLIYIITILIHVIIPIHNNTNTFNATQFTRVHLQINLLWKVNDRSCGNYCIVHVMLVTVLYNGIHLQYEQVNQFIYIYVYNI